MIGSFVKTVPQITSFSFFGKWLPRFYSKTNQVKKISTHAHKKLNVISGILWTVPDFLHCLN